MMLQIGDTVWTCRPNPESDYYDIYCRSPDILPWQGKIVDIKTNIRDKIIVSPLNVEHGNFTVNCEPKEIFMTEQGALVYYKNILIQNIKYTRQQLLDYQRNLSELDELIKIK